MFLYLLKTTLYVFKSFINCVYTSINAKLGNSNKVLSEGGNSVH